MNKQKLRDKAQAKHFNEIWNAEVMYDNLIDLATDVFDTLMEEAKDTYRRRLIEIDKDTQLKDKEVHMTKAFKKYKKSVGWAHINYNEDINDARDSFQEVIGYSHMIYCEDLHIADMDDRVESCAGPGGNDNDNDN